MTDSAPGQKPIRHALYEDALAIAMGTLFIAFGVMIYAQAQLVTGGTAGQHCFCITRQGPGSGWSSRP